MKRTPAPVSRLAALSFFALLLLPLAAFGTQAKEKSENGVVDFTLDNGLQVVVIPDRRAPIVTHMLWYKVGSADEEPGKSGIAHFFEHLMFKNTTTYSAGEFSQAVAAVGGNENAFTFFDYTAYYQQVAPDHLGTMMRFEADRMRNLVMSDENIETERQVVIEERRMRVDNVPGSILREEINATLYQNHPYSHPIIGWANELETLTHDDLVAFYNRFYTPNNAVLVVAGDVDAEEVRSLAEEYYGPILRGPDLPERKRPMEPKQKTMRTVTLKDPRVTVPSVSENWFVPGYSKLEGTDFEAIALLSNILGEGPRSRLYQELVVKQGIAASAGSYLQSPALDYSNLGVYANPRGETQLAELEAAVHAEIVKIKEEGVTAKELEEARKRIVREQVFLRDSQNAQANLYGSVLTTGGTIDDVQGFFERLKAVSADDVKEMARRYLDEKNVVKGYLLPAEEGRS